MVWSDLKFAVRGLIAAPGLSAAAIVALALGIGPNTAIFSIVYATVFAPLPYSNPDQLVRVSPMVGEVQDRASAAEYLEWKQRATSFQALEAFRPGRTLNLAIGDGPEIVIARQVTPGGHSMLSERVFLGRDFRADEDQPGKQHVVLLTHRLWRERFGADRDIIGRDIRMDSIPYTVIGVLEPGSWDRTPANIWIPISFTPAEIANRQLGPVIVDGRLKPGVTVAQAQQEMNLIAADLARQFPDTNARRDVRVVPLDTAILNSSRTMVAGTRLQTLLWSLLAAVSFVVLMACVNVANLLISRGVTRERETAIRAALGATRGRLVRLALIEGVLLAAIGGALGVLASVWILQGILAMLPPFTLASTVDPKLNLQVLLFALGATMFAGVLSGSAQAWQAGRTNFNDTLKQPGRSRAAGLWGAILTIWWAIGPSPTHAQTTVGSADVHLPIQNAAGLRMLVAPDHTSPVLRVILPGRPSSDRSIEILFPEHVTVVEQGQRSARQLYLFRPGQRGDRPLWRRSIATLEYERDLGDGLHLLAQATLESDGVRFRYEVTNESRVAYDMIYVPTDPRLTSIFHDPRLERTYVHHADGFDLLASETPRRLTIPSDQWLPARYLVSFTWPVPAQRIERRADGITYYNKSRAVDMPFIATVSTDKAWVVASFARTAGNVWSNPELTCQHVDPQTSLSPGQRARIELKLLVIRGSLDDALERAIRQRESLKSW